MHARVRFDNVNKALAMGAFMALSGCIVCVCGDVPPCLGVQLSQEGPLPYACMSRASVGLELALGGCVGLCVVRFLPAVRYVCCVVYAGLLRVCASQLLLIGLHSLACCVDELLSNCRGDDPALLIEA